MVVPKHIYILPTSCNVHLAEAFEQKQLMRNIKTSKLTTITHNAYGWYCDYHWQCIYTMPLQQSCNQILNPLLPGRQAVITIITIVIALKPTTIPGSSTDKVIHMLTLHRDTRNVITSDIDFHVTQQVSAPRWQCIQVNIMIPTHWWFIHNNSW